MKCPACQGTLAEKEQSDLTVDICDQGCGGIWFDNFELEKVDEAHESTGEPLLDIGPHKTVTSDREAKRLCPKCPEQKMQRNFFSVSKEVEVDECPACGGVWLDAGELVAIRDLFKTTEDRKKAFDEHFAELFGGELRRKQEANDEKGRRARKFANALRFVCPSYWIPGKQHGAAF